MEDFTVKYIRSIISDLDRVCMELTSFTNKIDNKDFDNISVVSLFHVVNVLSYCASILQVFLPYLNKNNE